MNLAVLAPSRAAAPGPVANWVLDAEKGHARPVGEGHARRQGGEASGNPGDALARHLKAVFHRHARRQGDDGAVGGAVDAQHQAAGAGVAAHPERHGAAFDVEAEADVLVQRLGAGPAAFLHETGDGAKPVASRSAKSWAR